jgi:DNA-binding transcriptional regulator GbsR (MarR family)
METVQPLSPLMYRACEAVGATMELWGFKRVHGMVWMYIFLQPKPVSAAEIKCALGISTGLVSMTLHELLHWDVVHRQSPPGDRKDYYSAELNIARPIMKVLRERELYQIGIMLEVLREVLSQLDENDPELAFARQQILALIQVGEFGAELFAQFIETGAMLLKGQLTWKNTPERTARLLSALRRFIVTQGETLRGTGEL